MDAKELRIGNYVIPRYASPDVDLYIEISAEELYKMDGKVYFFEPIPLTEKWLLAFGFEKPIMSWKKSIDDNTTIELSICNDKGKGEYYFMVRQGLSDMIMFSIRIFYVHQLQNLYYSLTGEELIKK